MIRLPDVPAIPAGDYSQIEPSSIVDKVFLFDDDTLGLCVSRLGTLVPVGSGSGLIPVTKPVSDVKVDTVSGGLYIELNSNAVLNCIQDGLQMNGGLDKNFTPHRYYATFNTTGTSIDLLTL